MKPITLRLDETEIAEIDAEAEERGFENRTEYIRWMIRNRDSIDPNTQQRLDEQEQRISALEERVG